MTIGNMMEIAYSASFVDMVAWCMSMGGQRSRVEPRTNKTGLA